MKPGSQVVETYAEPVKEPGKVKAVLSQKGKTISEAEVDLKPVRKWEVFIVHQTHLDIGYTHHQEEVLRIQVDGLKKAMKYIEASKDYPQEARFTWHPEGMWAIEEFLATATPQEKAQFIKKVKSGSIHQDVLYAQAMSGIYSEEELFELMGSAKRFERKYDIPPIVSAMQTDIPGHTWGLVP
ncbi:MAG: hypothetical protein GY800_06215, partial [Planctomycetes bacterium]|nr:hypothetical protein [Planctomycetota bacterium]